MQMIMTQQNGGNDLNQAPPSEKELHVTHRAEKVEKQPRFGEFGPWMLVTKQGRRTRDSWPNPNGKEGKSGGNRGKQSGGGSRFSILGDMRITMRMKHVWKLMSSIW